MKTAVLGHVEWLDFVRVPHLPRSGEILHATEFWSDPAGGGAVAAVQLAKLAGSAVFLTAVGGDDLGVRTQRRLSELGLEVHAAVRPEPQRRAITHLDGSAERTITVLGTRLSPNRFDPLPYQELAKADAVYLTAGDAEVVRLARKAKVLVATARVLPLLAEAGVYLDALVGSSLDPSEAYSDGDLNPAPGLVVRTCGSSGGWYRIDGEEYCRYPPTPLPGPAVDSYGCGDSFAAGLTYALGARYAPAEAIRLAANCGAAVAAGKGPYSAQLTSNEL
ncbi:MAG: PfkB family carbohydrate kinase [Actinomycetota bacterium]